MRLIISVREHEPIYIGESFSSEKKIITRSQAALLERLEKEQGKAIFNWGNKKIIPLQWVGVANIGNLQIEILPKLYNDGNSQIRKNLLYMIAVAKIVPFRVQEISNFDTQKHTFLECFIRVFIDRLGYAYKTGIIHQYNDTEENASFLRGKLKMKQQLRKNIFNKSRFFVQHDEYSMHNLINRIIKATVEKLITISKLQTNIKDLQFFRDLLSEVDAKGFVPKEFDKLLIPRTVHQSYYDILEMCKVIWREESPNLSSGKLQGFSLLFDMNVIYERFIQELISDRKFDILPPDTITISNRRGNSKFLFKNEYGNGIFRLLPDNVIYDEKRHGCLKIIDTKWKLLKPSERNFGISQSDIYQMYAYAREYSCKKVILLYPTDKEDFNVRDFPKFNNVTFPTQDITIYISTINLNCKLPEEIHIIKQQLKDICAQ
ncbi:McrC family protein [Paenibacillus glycanilyticus]|uniref:McrC family protein n=1 Tax=Paenibacillus glycanilyticus TaxID=126569 RepID=UPI003EBFC880